MGAVQGETRLRWSRLVPIVFITYSLAFVDRANYSFATAGGLAEDLGITASVSSLVAASFFAGYFLFQIPAAHFAERRSAVSVTYWCLILWGLFSSLQGFVSDPVSLIVMRFLLGVTEAAVFPALIILLTRWFRARERGRANTFLILGSPVTVMWMSAVTGYLIEVTSWRAMFVIEGVPAILFAFVFRKLVRDLPTQAPWMPKDEAVALEADLEREQAALPKMAGYGQAFRQPRVLILCVQYACWTIGIYGLVFWLPTIIKAGSNQGIGDTGLLSAFPYLLAVIFMVLNSRWSDRSSASRGRFVWPVLLASAGLFYLSYLVGEQHFLVSFLSLSLACGLMYAPYGTYFAAITEMLPRNVAGAATALVNSCGAVGSFLGTYMIGWLTGDFGQGFAFLFLAGSLLAASFLMLAVRAPSRAIVRAAPTPTEAAAS